MTRDTARSFLAPSAMGCNKSHIIGAKVLNAMISGVNCGLWRDFKVLANVSFGEYFHDQPIPLLQLL
jgi:hypothetical protein